MVELTGSEALQIKGPVPPGFVDWVSGAKGAWFQGIVPAQPPFPFVLGDTWQPSPSPRGWHYDSHWNPNSNVIDQRLLTRSRYEQPHSENVMVPRGNVLLCAAAAAAAVCYCCCVVLFLLCCGVCCCCRIVYCCCSCSLLLTLLRVEGRLQGPQMDGSGPCRPW